MNTHLRRNGHLKMELRPWLQPEICYIFLLITDLYLNGNRHSWVVGLQKHSPCVPYQGHSHYGNLRLGTDHKPPITKPKAGRVPVVLLDGRTAPAEGKAQPIWAGWILKKMVDSLPLWRSTFFGKNHLLLYALVIDPSWYSAQKNCWVCLFSLPMSKFFLCLSDYWLSDYGIQLWFFFLCFLFVCLCEWLFKLASLWAQAMWTMYSILSSA